MKPKLVEIAFILLALAVLIAPFFWIYATVTTCGWKGLFVECRITEPPK